MARSPSTGHRLRELQLESPRITTRAQALMFAESFARRLRDRQHMNVTDWQAQIDTVDPDASVRTL
jgi:hypothetical protein